MKTLPMQLAALCRRRAAEDRFLRRFRMMQDAGEADAAGPGWYESSRELAGGCSVRESAADATLLDDFLAAQRLRPVPRLAAVEPRD